MKHRIAICVILLVQAVFGGAAFSQRFKSVEERRREIKGKWKVLLEEAIKEADKIEIQSPIEDGKVFHVIEGNDKIKAFLDAVDISERRSTGPCECLGEGLLVFYENGEQVAALSYHHSKRLRWRDGPWVADAELTRKSGIELSQWFQSEGFGLFEQVRRDNIASRQRHKREFFCFPVVLFVLILGGLLVLVTGLALLVFSPLTKLRPRYRTLEIIFGGIMILFSILVLFGVYVLL